MFPLQRERFADTLSRVFLIAWLLGFWVAPRGIAQSTAPNAAANPVAVYVSDFELYAATHQPNSAASSPALPAKPPANSPAIYSDTDVPSVQARRLTDFFAVSLLQALSRKGFSVARVEGQKAPIGALIRGVFAEPDERNRIRRALLGGNSPNARFFLYVGIFNAARHEQPLYELAPTQSASDRYGPVITVNAYIPLAKYELDKNPSEEDVRRICNQIAASLISLLEKNLDAFAP